ncbi:MAG: acetyl-CoA C-acetyltransferase [Peptoniphilaceae bacterium]|nr:acetyl-CoA C-acetyltransferase [Peptoniphilaceae bacterium]
MGRKVVLAGAVRTAVGSMGGTLSTTPSAKLGEIVIREALRRAGVAPEQVDMVYMGNVLQAAQGQNVARQASVNAGLPVETPAVTINVVCGSGLESINMGARLIASGDADIVVAGGTENMSLAPYALTKGRYGYRMGDAKIVDTMTNDALTDAFNKYHMGITAENVAEKYNIDRKALDEFSVESQRRAVEARDSGRFRDEIVGVEVKQKKNTIVFDTDEGPRPGSSLEVLGRLRPAFKEGGLVTAGNASSINDGAAAVVLLSEEKAKELGVTPQVEWIDGTLAGVPPEIMGIGPIAATKKLCKKLGMQPQDFDLVEANEAFAAQAVACVRELGLDSQKVNVNGGAIAIGHPVGASGCRILVTLIHEMLKRDDVELGLATLCIGGGMGCAAAFRKVK